ncbi:pentapeptide repeat-containing protein [Okeania sp. KiyG1]|uniref:pentapeptide repeat-containing protein n=1 Tax=Okeania sp. KiyG1 TaxID=2720165 RepID=UPI0035C8AB7D
MSKKLTGGGGSADAVTFENCNFTGIDLSYNHFGAVHFIGCNLTRANFIGGNAYDTFEDCIFKDTIMEDGSCRTV